MSLYQIIFGNDDNDRYLMDMPYTFEEVEGIIKEFKDDDGSIDDADSFENWLTEHKLKGERVFVNEIYVNDDNDDETETMSREELEGYPEDRGIITRSESVCRNCGRTGCEGGSQCEMVAAAKNS